MVSDFGYVRYIMNVIKTISLASVFTVAVACQAFAAGGSFDVWLQDMRDKALQKGISSQTVNEALTDVQPIQRVLELDRKQPEGTMTFAKYKKRVINQARIDQGRERMRRYAKELAVVEEKYGVQPQYIVALWGLETSYGQYTGGFKVIDALATLAWDGRRSSFFTKELINALKILDEGHIDLANMKGSWAGAMGQNQFMPSSFHTFAVDGDNDGQKDIWTNVRDVFASSANYLSRSGWKGDERWGREIHLPAGFSKNLTGLDTKKTLQEWKNLGIKLPNGTSIPVADGMKASIVTPDGLGGPAFLVYDNYRTIMKWNRSTYFATSVGLLANAIAR